jgi:hypothetical protein
MTRYAAHSPIRARRKLPRKGIQNVMAEQPLNQIEEKPGYWAFPIES